VETSGQRREFLIGLHLASFDEQDQLDFSPILGLLLQDPNAARVFARFRHVEVPWRFYGRPSFAANSLIFSTQQFRQLRNIRRNPPRLVTAEWLLRSRLPPWLVLIIDIRQSPAVMISDDKIVQCSSDDGGDGKLRPGIWSLTHDAKRKLTTRKRIVKAPLGGSHERGLPSRRRPAILYRYAVSIRVDWRRASSS